MLKAMIGGIRAVTAASCVLIAIAYLFAIFFRQMAFHLNVEGDRVFADVPHSMFVLLSQAMIPDNQVLLAALFHQSWYLGLFGLCFFFLTAITIMNMIVGLMCEVMHCAATEGQQSQTYEAMSVKIKEVIGRID